MKRTISLLLALCLLVCALPLPALADEPTSLSNDELFAGYVQQQFYADAGISAYADDSHNAGSRLTGVDATIYQALKSEIVKIAQGQRESTEIRLPGVSFYDANSDRVINALLSDLPYELFWFDKTVGWLRSGNSSYCTFSFYVSETYSKFGAPRTFQVDTAKLASTQTAVDNAQAIVRRAAGLSDYEKLLAYKNAICDAVEYDYNAYTYGSSVVGIDPWQLIHVFDGDPSTNVVCEGYAKAFQYLCDMSSFSDPTVQCYSVTGIMEGIGHMWNIVTIGGANYLVDVTNCDGDIAADSFTVGFPERLFLVGYSGGSAQSGYVITTERYTLPNGSYFMPSNISYAYYPEQFELLGDVLNLSPTKYDPTSAPPAVDPTPTTAPTPSVEPDPTMKPTTEPSPTVAPTPTVEPTPDPTANPTTKPTPDPTVDPTTEPTPDPTASPTTEPTTTPTETPDVNPTTTPTSTPTTAPSKAPVFTDVPKGEYYADAVAWAVSNGITKGKSSTRFDPKGICTRAQIVTFLWRALDKPAGRTTGFADMPTDRDFIRAIEWADFGGITHGKGVNQNGSRVFQPGATCTRAEAVTFIWRAMGKPTADRQADFVDMPANGDFVKAINWAVSSGVTKGRGRGTFQPNGTCTRGEIVTFLHRAMADR